MDPKPARRVRLTASFRSFIESEAAGGIILMAVAALALILANSPLREEYFGILKTYIGGLSILHWVNDALMAVFFLLVGLEIKREMISGQLSNWSRRALPGFAAVGGMIVPALIFLAFNDGETSRGWAIPSATDIAFSLGVLSLLGSRVPLSLKVFLTALAIIDDLGAVIIIALFYTEGLNIPALAGVAAVFTILMIMNMMGIVRLWAYLVLGVILWILVFKSGIHATIAGVLLALAIPMQGLKGEADSPLLQLEHAIQPWVGFLIVPIFGFANAGVSFGGVSLANLADPVPLGVAAGLFVGKQVGVFSFAWLAIKLRLAERPSGASWLQMYGVATLCGIGFTMSLFIGLLAFANSPLLQDETKLGVLLGSLLSAVFGAFLLSLSSGRSRRT
ncbi:Na+/H+ antiporter NhaA [Phyllobacterium endophyticum]|uniref:Na(+)/H(+) antiporter NhaA n=1 Tax=Phyllobacterium endophyticum TaxID=1149773 RepID=A0A2P7AU48_9HYPH|nr:Na+/H+ antiporter NhaA [Phyllobacterium endophyticum]MBB3234166.1 NhaA family Na+:H+ antiporter [Phyllobacterium endophyticum]PSH57726.1 Na+/H+ antiporter NhaA [Phyllobacterium endophyticum]TYR43921.1 Na+/H+ antiporter NhaA [Phyllobacterium endophyticum]